MDDGFTDVKPEVSEKYFLDSSFFSAAFGLMISRPLSGVNATEEAIPLALSRPIVVLLFDFQKISKKKKYFCFETKKNVKLKIQNLENQFLPPPARTDMVPPRALARIALLLRAIFC